MQRKETSKSQEFAELSSLSGEGRLLSLDPGTKLVGVAVSDETRTVSRPLPSIERTSWKKLLSAVKDLVSEFDAKALVVGLPYGFDGEETPMSAEARDMARKFDLSLEIPVFLQDERVTSYEAKRRLWERKVPLEDTKKHVDSEAATIILSDFLSRL